MIGRPSGCCSANPEPLRGRVRPIGINKPIGAAFCQLEQVIIEPGRFLHTSLTVVSYLAVYIAGEYDTFYTISKNAFKII